MPISRVPQVPKVPKAIQLLNQLIADAEATPRWQRYFEPIPELSADLPAPILGVMVLIWQIRDQDLQHLYPLDTYEGRLGFVGWCATAGRQEYQAIRDATTFWDALRAPSRLGDALEVGDPAHAISCFMVLLAKIRPDLNADLASRSGRARLLAWYLHHGHVELAITDQGLEPWQKTYFAQPSKIEGLNRLEELLYTTYGDLHRHFPLPGAQQAFADWCRQHVEVRTEIGALLRSERGAAQLETSARSSGGVNVIGYAFGELGIGEDARMAAGALLAASVPMTMVNFAPGPHVRQMDRSLEAHVGDKAYYSTNMFCLTALEHARFLCTRGFSVALDRVNIGYWPWELAVWPQEWRHLFALVDEVWASSQHTFDALAPVCPVRLRLMPMAVEIPEPASRSRVQFGLPEKKTLFLFVFDLNSSAYRKNPRACLAAFSQAFPLGEPGAEHVGLVIKVHPPQGTNEEWTALKALRDADQRIYLIEETLTRSDLLALYQVTDCFVSLHRAEGFGRAIAEAMLLGKPVITTCYSGNLMFSRPDNSFLVRYTPVAVGVGEYPFAMGQVWADADVVHAAFRMREIVNSPVVSTARAGAGQRTIVQNHSHIAVGSAYSAALHSHAGVAGLVEGSEKGKP